MEISDFGLADLLDNSPLENHVFTLQNKKQKTKVARKHHI